MSLSMIGLGWGWKRFAVADARGGTAPALRERGARFFSAAASALVGVVFLPGCQMLPYRYNCKTLAVQSGLVHQSVTSSASVGSVSLMS
jgi:hypothetical protein